MYLILDIANSRKTIIDINNALVFKYELLVIIIELIHILVKLIVNNTNIYFLIISLSIDIIKVKITYLYKKISKEDYLYQNYEGNWSIN